MRSGNVSKTIPVHRTFCTKCNHMVTLGENTGVKVFHDRKSKYNIVKFYFTCISCSHKGIVELYIPVRMIPEYSNSILGILANISFVSETNATEQLYLESQPPINKSEQEQFAEYLHLSTTLFDDIKKSLSENVDSG